jgi:multidrug efflux pump subunit AcrB
MEELKTVPGAIEVDRNLRFSAGEFTFNFDPRLLAQFGVSQSEAALTLRTYLFGTEATTFLDEHDEEIAVRLTAPETLQDAASLATVPLSGAGGEAVRLGQVATTDLATSTNTIRRRDGERSITITANTSPDHTPAEVSTELARNGGHIPRALPLHGHCHRFNHDH